MKDIILILIDVLKESENVITLRDIVKEIMKMIIKLMGPYHLKGYFTYLT